MSNVWLAFWVGAFLGALVAFVVLACCVVAREADKASYGKIPRRQ